jgi:hypothetical protein
VSTADGLGTPVAAGWLRQFETNARAALAVVRRAPLRNWFAARRFGFKVTADSSVRPMPGPSVHRIIKAVARRPQSA